MNNLITAERYHDISCGHRVVGHENKCKYLHGHNYRFHFKVAAPELDKLGRVMDFSVIKEKLCQWLEDYYDHKFLVWEHDPLLEKIAAVDEESIIVVPYNPTAENIALHIMKEVAPYQLAGTGCILLECKIEETRKCSATVKHRDV